MTRITKVLLLTLLLLFLGRAGHAVTYTWNDPDGSYHATDRVDKLPARYQGIVRHDVDHYVTPEGIGFEKDDMGRIRFFDHTSPAKEKTKRPEPALDGPPGSAVTAQQLAEIKRRYLEWGGEPKPQLEDGKVVRIISADTFELADGRKVTYAGIEYPDELKGNTRLHEEVVQYQEKLMKGRTIKMVFGPQRQDEKGRTVAYVYLGTDMFVNADLVMNGYARSHVVPPNVEYRSLFNRLENFAKRSMLGMWEAGAALPAGQ